MPHLFQLLGYPVPLKPSTMQTIGASHTMHILLGAITWLIDVVRVRGNGLYYTNSFYFIQR